MLRWKQKSQILLINPFWLMHYETFPLKYLSGKNNALPLLLRLYLTSISIFFFADALEIVKYIVFFS